MDSWGWRTATLAGIWVLSGDSIPWVQTTQERLNWAGEVWPKGRLDKCLKLQNIYGHHHPITTSLALTSTTRGKWRSSSPSTKDCPQHKKYFLFFREESGLEERSYIGPWSGSWTKRRWLRTSLTQEDTNSLLSFGFISALSLSYMPLVDINLEQPSFRERPQRSGWLRTWIPRVHSKLTQLLEISCSILPSQSTRMESGETRVSVINSCGNLVCNLCNRFLALRGKKFSWLQQVCSRFSRMEPWTLPSTPCRETYPIICLHAN